MNSTVSQRIAALRTLMEENKIDAYIISSSDPHMSEYPATHWKARKWISGFTGSAGTVVITHDKAGLWTDSRYFLQAEEQLEGTGIDLFRMMLPQTPTIPEFLVRELKEGQTVGFAGETFSIAKTRKLKEQLNRAYLRLETGEDLINGIWTDRPSLPSNPLVEMPVSLSGESSTDKIGRICNELDKMDCNCTLLTALDEIAWTFNIRGNDVSYNPVAVCYAFISRNQTILFIEPEKVPEAIAKRLTKENILLRGYREITSWLAELPAGTSLFIDPSKVNTALYRAIPKECVIREGASPANYLKSIKNETEKEGFRRAVIKDGIALSKFYFWLEKSLREGKKVTEVSASDRLTTFRAEQEGYLSDSFATICGFGAHGAIVHYSATPESDVPITGNSLLLMDSGAQYREGTTDITRTIAIGEPTEGMKADFTAVLKGNIALSRAVFPVNTRGSQLDVLARQFLWQRGINYLHGTGHGIGHCLNVHEGPQSIRMEENPVTLQPGMVTSNEPAMYRTGKYGIRIENIILVKEKETTSFGHFLAFETLTLCYIDTRLIEKNGLSSQEKEWLNSYHAKVYETISPYLTPEEKEWLEEKTKAI